MIALSVMAAAVLAAQADGPSSFKGSRRDAELAMTEFAMCEVRSPKGRAAALAYGREVPGTPSTYRDRLVKSLCAPSGTSMSFNPELFRMTIYPALYAKDFGKAAPAVNVALLPTDYAAEFDSTPDTATVEVRRLGDCVVKRDVAAAREFVLSKPYSRAEDAALATIRPALAACLPAGQSVRLSRSVAHGAIGEALYKLTAASAATKAS
ncbi:MULTISPECIES: hypothetical protein [Sphingomonas]|jgi:hypothetical protein|uniref:Uncharacterized protein n=1 Tax=Sphingomonas hankookensis TaxID=563996 RepID=A0ABR5YHJ9_9SPHN|nr:MULTISPECIES: hypothetical protein [Sphingomonas]KZE18716.1 hypothetical protein AVT10_01355 [Sphingomonas hankookensis]PZT94854.1 MAG: hypothetical protein DI625_04705 [Sphingomonas sp.]RSV33583.1 hypothetical protein CA237_00150 [Sphingomonas sp. ABOLH]WCP70612.1 hypothetical protein PPZ50_09425 [Sphingomonas hankookensis]